MAAEGDGRRHPRPREQRRLLAGGRDTRCGDGPVQAELDYRQPIDLGEEIELAEFAGCLAFVTGDAVKAVARAGPI